MKEIDYRALRLMIERSTGSELKKNRELKKFDQAWNDNMLFYAREETSFQKWIRCEARFTLGNYEDWSGWQYRDRWAEQTWFNNPFKVPVWTCQPTGTLYIIGEQGLGDEILLSQCIENVKPFAKEIVYETQERLQPIFERSFGVKTRRALVGADRIRRAQPFEADHWVSLGELPRLYRKKPGDFTRKPYIAIDPGRVSEMEPYRGRTGISWRGAQGRISWKELLRIFPDAISLQYDQSFDEDVPKPHIDLMNDLDGVLALMSVLKKMVTVSTTAAHMAASSGVDVDVIIAPPETGIHQTILPWRWLDKSQTKVPRKAWWYGDNVHVYENFNEWRAYNL